MASEAVQQAEAAYCAAVDAREAAWQKLCDLNRQSMEAERVWQSAQQDADKAARDVLDAVYDDREAHKFLPESAPARRIIKDGPQA